MSETPRRTARVPDEVWDPAVIKAGADGTSLGAVITALLAGWLRGESSDSTLEYRATPRIAGAGPVVEGLTGSYATVRQQFPASAWALTEREVSSWRPAQRRNSRTGRSDRTPLPGPDG